MSRSLHTQKLELRAARRLARPYAKRREEAASLRGRSGVGTADHASTKRLPIRAHKPLSGTRHPLSPQDIREFLAHLGPTAIYGLKAIRLRAECAFTEDGILFAEYLLSGEIHLYAVPPSPWRLPFVPAAEECAAFARHDAWLTIDAQRRQTMVEWTQAGLKAFLLYEVLAHELGHHRLQRRKGQRRIVACRRSDHERYATLHSRRAWQETGSRPY